MTYSKTLEDFGATDIDPSDENKPGFSIGKAVRNASFHSLDPEHLGECQRLVFECLLKHPKGLNDKGIRDETGLPKTSVCARRNELMKLNLVGSCGIGYFPDYKGRLRANTLWSIISNGGTI